MLFKRFVQVAIAALLLTAAQPGSAQQVLKVGSTPTGVPFSFLDTKNYAALEDLKGEVVGAQVGTAFVDALKKTGLFADVKAYDTIPDILRDVNTGRLKAGFADYPILAYNLKQGGFPEARLVDSYKPTIIGTVAIGVRKGDAELLGKINTSLAKLKANGEVDKILDKWGLKSKGA